MGHDGGIEQPTSLIARQVVLTRPRLLWQLDVGCGAKPALPDGKGERAAEVAQLGPRCAVADAVCLPGGDVGVAVRLGDVGGTNVSEARFHPLPRILDALDGLPLFLAILDVGGIDRADSKIAGRCPGNEMRPEGLKARLG